MASLMSELACRWQGPGARTIARELLPPALYACAVLGYHPGGPFIEEVCRVVLYGEDEEGDEEEEGEGHGVSGDGGDGAGRGCDAAASSSGSSGASQAEGLLDGWWLGSQKQLQAGAAQPSAGSRLGSRASSRSRGNTSDSSTNSSHHCNTPPRLQLSAQGAARMLWCLVCMGEVNIRRLGMACMALREGGSARKLSTAQLSAVAAAAVALGEEGREMVEEVREGVRVVKKMFRKQG